jgi:hypothetical protein
MIYPHCGTDNHTFEAETSGLDAPYVVSDGGAACDAAAMVLGMPTVDLG